MLFRLLSGIGAIAHLGDVLLSPIKFAKPSPHPVARGARIAGALVVAVLLGCSAGLTLSSGLEGANNRQPTVYSVDELFGSSTMVAPDLHGKTYVTVTAMIGPDYVENTRNNVYQYADYVIGNPATGNCIIVESKKPLGDIEKLIGADGSITVTGMIRSDRAEVETALRTLGDKADGLNISKAILLREGETPANAETMFVLTGIFAVIAALLAIGWAIGYLVFRPAAVAVAPFGASMTGPINVHVTGLIPGSAYGTRTREKSAVLQVPTAPDGTVAPVGPMDLLWRHKLTVDGVRLTPGVTNVETGTAYPFKGARPAVRFKYFGYKLILSFDNEQDRIAAYTQLRAGAAQAAGFFA